MPSPLPRGTAVLATYAPTSTPGQRQEEGKADEAKVAAVLARPGKGRAVLSAVHFEYPLTEPPARDAAEKLQFPPTAEDIERSEKERVEWATELLEILGLKPPVKFNSTPEELAPVHGNEDPEVLLHPTHPSPIFVLPHPSLPQLGSASFDPPALKAKLTPGEGSGEQILRDGNDELHIRSVDTVTQAGPSEIPSYLAQQRRTKPVFPPKIEDLSLEKSSSLTGTGETTPEPPQMPDLNALPKLILTPSTSAEAAYTPRWTPLFNFDTYWREIDTARKRHGRKSGVLRKTADGEKQSLGDLVWYAESITSTQTILDRNPLLLTSLPSPLVCMASFQLSGRGRGSNVWLSPPGCLQFSILLTLPSSLSSKLVFIQYLMALAVSEAVDEDGRLGVRIKWPNDIYAEVEGVGGSEVGSGKKGRAKLGGILVNTNYIGGQWRIVVGCGINVLNALPTTSLSQLHNLLAARSPTPVKPLPPPPSMEGTFAKIMNSFEQKWEQFIEEKGFSGFLDEYYGRWLHSCVLSRYFDCSYRLTTVVKKSH